MIALRLVHLIETHSDELASGLVRKLQLSPHTRDLQKVPVRELRERASEIYRHLSEWLLHSKEDEVERLYAAIGARRAAQDVALADVCWAIMLTKENLWDFVEDQGFLKSSHELMGELELLRLLDHFFDRALCYVVEGYEQMHAPKVA